jgi:hypothetical protein
MDAGQGENRRSEKRFPTRAGSVAGMGRDGSRRMRKAAVRCSGERRWQMADGNRDCDEWAAWTPAERGDLPMSTDELSRRWRTCQKSVRRSLTVACALQAERSTEKGPWLSM